MKRAANPTRSFFARPFWRDYLLACLLIGLGFMLTSPHAPIHLGMGVTMLASGAIILLMATGWSIHTAWRTWRKVNR